MQAAYLGLNKLVPRTRKAVLMRYSETQKRYKLFDLDNKTFFISRDVNFRERTFPFRSMPIDNEDDVLFKPVTNIGGTQIHNA